MAKNGKETRLKTPKTAARLAWNLKHGKQNTTEIRSGEFKCTREHILCHDLLIKITWDQVRAQNREESSESVNSKHPPRKFFHVNTINQ